MVKGQGQIISTQSALSIQHSAFSWDGMAHPRRGRDAPETAGKMPALRVVSGACFASSGAGVGSKVELVIVCA